MTSAVVVQALSEILQDVLQVDRISPEDNLFTLGGDSVAAVALLWHIQERFSVQLSVSDVFAAGSLQQLGATISCLQAPESTSAKFFVNPHLDRSSLEAEFRGRGYVSIPDFLDAQASPLLAQSLRARSDWGLRLFDGTRTVGMEASAYAECDARTRRQVIQRAYSAAQRGFAFLREELCLDDNGAHESAAPAHVLQDFARFVQTEPFLSCVARLVGQKGARLLALSAQRYAPGHFLGCTADHDRQAGYEFVLDLTPDWPLEWGGILQFANPLGRIERGYGPRHNALVLYSTDKVHSISLVSPFADSVRYSIFGQIGVA